jgi:hypothetical protein
LLTKARLWDKVALVVVITEDQLYH